jgi:hypothetical protein
MTSIGGTGFDLPRFLLIAALGALVACDALTLYHYKQMIRQGRETSPFHAVLFLRVGAKLLCIYLIVDMLGRWGEPLSWWRFPLAMAALLARGYGVFQVLRYVYAARVGGGRGLDG